MPDLTATSNLEMAVDDLHITATNQGLTVRLETEEPEERWPSVDVTWATLSEWHERTQPAGPRAEQDDPVIAEAMRIHNDHAAALGGITYDTCISPSCWAVKKILLVLKGVNFGQSKPGSKRRKAS